MQHLPHHLGDVLGVHRKTIQFTLHAQHRLDGLVVLCFVDEVQLQHALEHIVLTDAGPARIDHRVVGRGCLGQAGQHGGLGGTHFVQRLAEVNLGCRREAVGSLAKVDLIDVELEDLILGQRCFDLERQQRLVDLSRPGALR